MKDVDARLTALEEQISEAESLVRGLRQENMNLRGELDARSGNGAGDGAEQTGGRSYRLVALEAERDEVRSRLRTLLDAL